MLNRLIEFFVAELQRLIIDKVLNHLLNEMTKKEIAYLILGMLIDMLIQEVLRG